MKRNGLVILRRASSLALFAGLCLGTLVLLLASAGTLDGEVRRLSTLKADYTALAGRTDDLRRDLSVLQTQRHDGIRDLLPGTSSAQAAAALEDVVRGAIEQSGGRIDSLEILPLSPEDGLERIGMRVLAGLDHAGLQGALHQLESGRPLIFIDALQVKPDQTRSAFRRRAAPDEAVGLKITVTLHAFLEPARRGAVSSG